MRRADLLASTAIPSSGLVDEAGNPIPSSLPTVDVRSLPVIAADALPPLPPGIEARLYQDPEPDGHAHQIILWCDRWEVSVSLPLANQVADRSSVTRAALAMVASLPADKKAA